MGTGIEMKTRDVIGKIFCVAVCLAVFCGSSPAKSFKYKRMGSVQDAHTTPAFGIAMMGGGTDLDDAFRPLCEKANGGDFLILRARGSDDYNPYVNGLCKLNSVATLVIPNKEAAQNPRVAEIIWHA